MSCQGNGILFLSILTIGITCYLLFRRRLIINATVCFGSGATYHNMHLNVRFQYKADIRVEYYERLLSSESGHLSEDTGQII